MRIEAPLVGRSCRRIVPLPGARTNTCVPAPSRNLPRQFNREARVKSVSGRTEDNVSQTSRDWVQRELGSATKRHRRGKQEKERQPRSQEEAWRKRTIPGARR